MISSQDLNRIEITLLDKMLAHLAVRWPKAAAYIPEGGSRVLCAGQLSEDEQANLAVYILAFREAIQDILGMLDKSGSRPAPPPALLAAERSVFQGGSLPPRLASRPAPQPRNPARARSLRRMSEARRKLEALFEGGRDDG